MGLKPQGCQRQNVFRRKAVFIVALLTALYILWPVLQDTVYTHEVFSAVAYDEHKFRPTETNKSYLVRSPKCNIPNSDPFDESIRKFFTLGKPLVCSTKPPLTYIKMVNEDAPKYLLKVNTTALADYAAEPKNVNCCYSVINRVNEPDAKEDGRKSDDQYSVGECSDFKTEVTLKSEEEFVLVRCSQRNESGENTELYNNTHAVVPMKPDVKLKLNRSSSEKSSVEEKRLSVLLLGFDSMSRHNLIRTMPNTVQYLRSSGWLELLGYNKVGINTFPNLVAFLTGLSVDQLKKHCWLSRDTHFDDCPLIWREYSDLGYVTAYVEDCPTLSTFNYQKTGFRIPPTDFYIRPFLLASEQKLPVERRHYMEVCLGPTPTSEHMFQYVTNFATVFKSNPYFLLSWINNFSHTSNAIPEKTDERVAMFFHQLEETGAFNTTFIIFLSDHGMRWGDIRKTSIGWYEEHLPFIYVWVPEWFKQKRPDIYESLKTNRRRLTTPFDLHLTLREILRLSGPNNTSSTTDECPGCPKCVSLFSEVSADRNCEDAGIPDNFCTCNEYRNVTTKGNESEAIAMHVLGEINAKLKQAGNISASCAELRLDCVTDLKQKVSIDWQEYFIVTFATLPGGAKFEATVLRSKQTIELKGDVSRITSYGNQADCVNDAELRLYCYCI